MVPGFMKDSRVKWYFYSGTILSITTLSIRTLIIIINKMPH